MSYGFVEDIQRRSGPIGRTLAGRAALSVSLAQEVDDLDHLSLRLGGIRVQLPASLLMCLFLASIAATAWVRSSIGKAFASMMIF